MLRFAFCLALLLCALCPLAAQPVSAGPPGTDAVPASAASTPLTLGPDVLTFPEIAQKLSVGGHKVTCAPALEQYAAYVYVKNRAWDKASRLLQQGLQIQMRPGKDDPNSFTMEWDSDTRRRERAWLSRFAGNLAQFLQEQVAVRAGYLKLPPETLKQQYESANAEIGEYEKNDPSVKNAPLRIRQLIKQSHDMTYVASENSIEQRLDLAWAQNNLPSVGDVLEMVRRGSVYHIQDITQVPPPLLSSIMTKHYPPEPGIKRPDIRYLVGAWKLGSSALGVGIHTYMALSSLNGFGTSLHSAIEAYVPPNVQDEKPLLQFVFAGVPEDADEHRFNGLGKPALQWLQAEQKQTRATLKETRLQDVPLFDLNDGRGDQSRRLETWSRKSDTEVIIVLWPQREAVSPRAPRPQPAADAGSDTYDPASPWMLHKTEGVLCIRNAMAFLDRERVLPTAALIQYMRSEPSALAIATPTSKTEPAKTEPAAPAVSAYEKLRDYCKAAANTPVPFWQYPSGLSYYRDLNASLLDQTIGAMFLWERLPPKERTALLEQARKAPANTGNSASMPLTHFNPRDRAKLARILQGWGMEYAQSSLPGFADALSGCMLSARVLSTGANKPYLVRLAVNSSEEAPMPVWGCEAEFSWQP